MRIGGLNCSKNSEQGAGVALMLGNCLVDHRFFAWFQNLSWDTLHHLSSPPLSPNHYPNHAIATMYGAIDMPLERAAAAYCETTGLKASANWGFPVSGRSFAGKDEEGC
jgi:hypothetical protein